MLFNAALGLGLIALLLGIGLGFAARKFGVTPDEREERALAILPGANCGGCGYPGCQAFVSALIKGEAEITGCPAGGSDVHRRLAEAIGAEFEETEPAAALVRCRGGAGAAASKFQYRGLQNCLAAGLLGGGPKACAYGCLGFGDCARACPFGAITMGGEGLPEISSDKCTGCGVCVKACPRGIIELAPASREVYVACVSTERGKDVKQACSAGCIGCGICARVSPEGAVVMQSNLPVIKTNSAEDLKSAIEKCPARVLIKR